MGMDFVRPVEAIVPGVQGRVLAVLTETTTDLNMRTIARLADVSLSQASRVLAPLVELGVVERRDVPPSSLFRLGRANQARDHEPGAAVPGKGRGVRCGGIERTRRATGDCCNESQRGQSSYAISTVPALRMKPVGTITFDSAIISVRGSACEVRASSAEGNSRRTAGHSQQTPSGL